MLITAIILAGLAIILALFVWVKLDHHRELIKDLEDSHDCHTTETLEWSRDLEAVKRDIAERLKRSPGKMPLMAIHEIDRAHAEAEATFPATITPYAPILTAPTISPGSKSRKGIKRTKR